MRLFYLLTERGLSAATNEDPKSEARNPKSETNPKSQCSNVLNNNPRRVSPHIGILDNRTFGFWICFGVRASNFGFGHARTVRASYEGKST
jgi:hypothetical protein